jgi:outer membrane lipoprotein-sorting protein
MMPTKWIAGWLLVACAASAPAQVGPDISSAEIVARNAAARGGTEAWRKIETMAWTGHVESANARGHNLPFLLQQERPNKARFEIVAEGQKSVRAYDGSSGWKLRTASGERPEFQPYTAEELKFARDTQVIDGPLMDYATKGGLITVLGVDVVAGRKAYVLDVKLPVGGLRRVWVDAETFLELRHDREFRNASGQPAVASIFYGDYRPFEGLLLPVTIETSGMDGRPANKVVIERVALNPPLEASVFTQPPGPAARRPGAVVVDTRPAARANPMAPAAPR